MPHFSKCCPGSDDYICQVCGKIRCSGCKPSVWRTDITGYPSAGNVCPECLKAYIANSKVREAIYMRPKSFLIMCTRCGVMNITEMTITDFSVIHMVCTKCGSNERIGG